MIKGKLIIHIGPPKTATTSLQYYWLDLNIKGFKYLGINQPRGSKTLGDQLYKYISSKIDDKILEEELIESIEANILKYQYIVISEEMFVLEQLTNSYIEKLEKLHKITERFQPIITYCVRNAEQVYFSYYTEIYQALPRMLQNNFEKFQSSSYCGCFKYKKLYDRLLLIGFKKINFFSFESLVNGTLFMNDILGIEDSNYSFKVNLIQKNVTKKKNINNKVVKKGKFNNIILWTIRLIPRKIKGLGLGSVLRNTFLLEKNIKLKEQQISNSTKSEYMNDINFLKSLKN